MSTPSRTTSQNALLQPNARVLSTLEADGKRRWLRPRLAKGPRWNARRWVAYGLIAIYAIAPYVTIDGVPLILLDVVRRQFHIAGVTFLPTDTALLALLVLIAGLGVFLATAVLGRVWCGWACPQTVYMEFVFRPIERLFCGTVGRGGPAKRVAAWRTIAMYVVYVAIAFHLAHTLLAYFVGVGTVHEWIWRSTPFQHPAAFAVVAIATAWIVWDFAYWREQMCIIGCPYGRMQSVLLDRNSLIVSYDAKRGEPRGKTARAVSLPTLDAKGDCIDCTMCVQVCPTGIDIRDGLQLECINCAQCIDACDSVMDRVGRDRGLIGYASQAQRDGERSSWLRPRILIYPALLAALSTLFALLLVNRPAFDLTVLRNAGRAFNVLPDGTIENTMRLKIVNRSRGPRTYSIHVPDGVTVHVDGGLTLQPLESALPTVRISLPADTFKSDHTDLEITVRSDAAESRGQYIRLLGPIAKQGALP